MKRLEVQRFLETKSLKELEDEWGVCARVSTHGHKVSLNYDMVLWTPGHVPSEQCRGLVLSLSNGKKFPVVNGKVDSSFVPGPTDILAYPMDKFYNIEEGHAAKIDWSDPGLRVYDKLDGTLCIVYWDPSLHQWCVATRSVPDADLPIDGFADMTFSGLFKEGVQNTTGKPVEKLFERLSKGNTYCFELTSPRNRILVEYEKAGVTLLSVRRQDLAEVTFETAHRLEPVLKEIPTPKTWNVNTVESIREYVNSLSPTECEGAVVVTGDLRRIKIKSAKWVIANATKTTIGASPRNLVKFVLQGVGDDIKAVLPQEISGRIDSTKERVVRLFHECDENFRSWRSLSTSRKHFAEMVSLHQGWQGPYFRLYDAHCKGKSLTTWEYVQSLLKVDKLTDTFIDGLLRHVGTVGSDDNKDDKKAVSHQRHPGLH